MEKRDTVGGSANVTENSPIAGAGNGCVAGRHADEASSTADVIADRSARPYDRGETIEDILLELNATSRSAVPAPVETPQAPVEESDRDSTCDKKTESIASSGCGAHALEEDDLRNPGVDPEPRSSEIDYDDYIVADEASADEGTTQDDCATKDENEDRVPLPPSGNDNNGEEKNECSEAAATSSEKAGGTVVAETVKVTQLDSPVKSMVGSQESGGVKESKMSSGPVSEVPGTPRRTGRQRNAPQRLADGTEKRSPERKQTGPQKPAAEAAAAELLTVDQNHHAEAVPNGNGNLAGQTYKQVHPKESPSSSPHPRCISGSLQNQDLWTLRDSPSWRAEQFVSSDRLLRETVCLGLREREVTTGPAFLTIEVPSSGLDPRRCWGPKSARRRPTVVFGGCDPYKMYVNVHGTRVLLQQWSRVSNITPTVRLTDMFATFSLK
ncbi:hypothetical protein IscW_ISCW013316 [Ixodes scapularis]|uniref:Uncharacterized protein n=1 Tax=Ixodes scapularis TaxID=6945 RepID=B7QAK5_IXOSC|nr:hypothetical protein IscW_ISCW013316 [Ixodes scapularis]|eukprot:XP_002412581.1 hypothetical protein IscW_ISCW013316 [Ixodes scapularis]